MKCYNCSYDKLDHSVKNCPICGVDLTNVCNECKNIVPKSAKFCTHCGAKMAISKEVEVEKKIEVGVIFADISGFTSLAENYTSEETKTIINDCFKAITKPIYELNGTIHKYIGDCVMALFTEGTEREIALNTVECTIKMNEYLNNYLTINHPNLLTPLNVSIGANIGEVIMGNLGTTHDSEYTVIGDTVNTASRLQTNALAGTVLVTSAIKELTSTKVNYSDQLSITVKNKKEPLNVYQPLSLNTNESTNTFYIPRTIDHAIENYLNLDKKDYILNITGESGIGKTTTIDHIVNNKPLTTFYTVKLSIWDEANPYAGFVQILNQIISSNNDSNQDMLLKNYLEYIMRTNNQEDTFRTYQFLLLILKKQRTEEYNIIFNSMSYQDLHQEMIEQATKFLSAVQSSKELLFIYDNADYLDTETLKILLSLDNNYNTILLSRNIVDTNEVILPVQMNKLSVQQVKEYLKDSFTTTVSEEMFNQIFTIINGSPLYLHEIIKLIKQHQETIINNQLVISKDVLNMLPSTINKLYQLRLQSFDKHTRDILSLSSLFVTELDFLKISQILKLNYNVEIEEHLLDLNIIEVSSYYRHNNHTYKNYFFTNGAFKDAVALSLTNKQKTKYHKAIAKELLIDNTNNDIIAYHYSEAKNYIKAKDQYLLSAYMYLDEFNVPKAEKSFLSYIETIEILERMSIESNVISSYIELAKLMIYKGDFVKAITYITLGLDLHQTKEEENNLKILLLESFKGTSNIEKALPLIEELNNTLQKTSENYGKLLKIQSTVYNMTGQSGVIELVDQATSILVKTEDFENLSEAVMQAGIRYFITGDIKKGIDTLEKAMAFSNKAKNKNVTAKIMINLGILYNNYGEEEKSNTLFINALKLSKQINNNSSYVTAAINLGVSYLNKGSFKNALKTFKESVSRSKTDSLLYQHCISLSNLGDVYHELGDFDNAFSSYNKSLELSTMMTLPIESAINTLGLCKTRIITNDIENEEDVINALITDFNDGEELEYVSNCYFALSDFFILKEQLVKAENSIKKALEYAKKSKSTLAHIRALRKQLEINLLTKEYNEDLYKEVVEEASSNNQYYELAKVYYTMYLNTKEDKYLKQAKDVLIYFDRCFISELITKS